MNPRRLTKDIESLLFKYLSERNEDTKSNMLYTLKGCIEDLYNVFPHDNKFLFSYTSEIISKSIDYIANYDVSKAASAFYYLSLYAQNIYCEPWRKEFHEIKLYSGFFKHNIKDCIYMPERFLKFCGYTPSADGESLLLTCFEKQNFAKFVLEAIFAMTECEIMERIYNRVKKVSLFITMHDVSKMRQSYVGSAEEMIDMLITGHPIHSAVEFPPIVCCTTKLCEVEKRSRCVPRYCTGGMCCDTEFSLSEHSDGSCTSSDAATRQCTSVETVRQWRNNNASYVRDSTDRLSEDMKRHLQMEAEREDHWADRYSRTNGTTHQTKFGERSSERREPSVRSERRESLARPSEIREPAARLSARRESTARSSERREAPARLSRRELSERPSDKHVERKPAKKSAKRSTIDSPGRVASKEETTDVCMWTCEYCNRENEMEFRSKCFWCGKDPDYVFDMTPPKVGHKECLGCSFLNTSDAEACIMCSKTEFGTYV